MGSLFHILEVAKLKFSESFKIKGTLPIGNKLYNGR